MKLSFTKMHGCGNNYIYINCFDQKVTDPETLSIALSEPHFGIGGDGIILISPSDRADAQMRIFNADGSEGKMCGNGIRCVGKYLYDNGMVGGRTTITIDTLSGVKTLELNVRDGKMQTARVDMGAAILEPAKIPVNMAGSSVIDAPLVVDEKVYHVTCVSMGNPHCVIFFNEDDVDDLDLSRLGPQVRASSAVPRTHQHRIRERPAGRQPQDARLGARLGRDLGLRHGRVRDRRCGLPERLLQAGHGHHRAPARRRPHHSIHH